MMPVILIVAGFVTAALPSMVQGVWNGQSLLGMIVFLIGAVWMIEREARDV